MESQDLDYVMNTLKSFGEQYFANNNDDKNAAVIRRNVKGNKVEDQTCVFKEVPPFMLALMREMAKNILEQQKNNIDIIKREFNDKLKEKDDTIANLKSELRLHRNEQDALGNYNRRENLRIQGVEYSDGENNNEIVKEICKYAGREITDEDISTSHRNGSVTTASNTLPGMSTAASRKIPDIYVRFVRRDVKTEIFDKRKNLATNTSCPAKYRNISIYEDVTPLRSRIMYELRQRNDKKEFQYVWSRGGSIFCKTPAQVAMTPSPRPYVINKPEDLAKVGFSDAEIEDIILNKRD